jgi:hypothetical protein
MSFSKLSLDESPAWGVVSPPASDLVKDALRKEQLLKYAPGFFGSVIPYFNFQPHRDIAASQDDLRSPFVHISCFPDTNFLF